MENSSHLGRWALLVEQNLVVNRWSLPVETLIREAVGVACSLKKRWEPNGKIPGLRSMPDLSLSMADDLLSIIRATHEAQLLFYVEEESAPIKPEETHVEKARRLVSALRAPLEYLEDTLPPTQQAQLKKFRSLTEYKENDEGSLYLWLRIYYEVAATVPEQLAQLGETVAPNLLQESKEHLASLERLIKEGTVAPQRSAQRLYYQMLALLSGRVGKIRTAAAYVYRDHKKVLREFTSSYERNRRRKSKQEVKKRG